MRIFKMAPVRNEIWKFFTKIDDSSFIKCRLCEKKLKSSNNISNMIQHVKLKHKKDDDEIMIRQSNTSNNAVSKRISSRNHGQRTRSRNTKNVRPSADCELFRDSAAAKDARDNAYKELENLQAANESLYSSNNVLMLKLQNLQMEAQACRQQLFKPESIPELKQKYECTKQVLAATIKSQEKEIGKREEVVQKLLKENKQMEEHLHKLESDLEVEKMLEENNKTASELIKVKLEEAIRQKEELEKTLEANKRIIVERCESEKSSLQKIQEAFSIAAEAVAQKEEAERFAEIIKEECHKLSSTIGCVMEETAKNVQENNEALRKQFEKKERALLDAQNKLKADLQNQVKITEALQTRASRYEAKCKRREKEKYKLTNHLHSATKALHEMQETLKAQDLSIKEYTVLKKRAEDNEKEIERCKRANDKQKKKFRCSLKDIKKRFKREIDHIKNENDNLKADNRFLKEKYDKLPDCPQ